MEGIVLSLEQTENYERARGPEGDRDEWHDRTVGIDDAVAKGVEKVDAGRVDCVSGEAREEIDHWSYII